MGLKEFTRTEIHSNIMGIPITITEEVIGRAARRDVEGSFQWNLNNKTSSWKEIVHETPYKNNASNKYKDMQKEHKVLQKLLQECFLRKGGGVDQLSLEHKVFLHFFVKFEKVNLPRYIFHHMLWALRESQEKERRFIPYGRLLSEIFHQGGILNALRLSGVVSDDQLRTVVGKYINASILKSMYLVKNVKKLDTDLDESMIVSDLITNFPPISKDDPPEVLAAFVMSQYDKIGEIINYSSIPDTMAGTPMRIATKKRKSKKSTSEDGKEEASQPKPKRVKKEKATLQVSMVEPVLPTIQEEVEDLEPVKVLDKRTRGEKSVGSLEVVSVQQHSKIHKKKRSTIRTMKESQYVLQEEEEVEAATSLVTRMERKKKATEASLIQQVVNIANEIKIPPASLFKEIVGEDAQKVVELAEDVQELVANESDELLKINLEDQRKEGTSEAATEAATSEAAKGISPPNTFSDNLTELDTSSPSSS